MSEPLWLPDGYLQAHAQDLLARVTAELAAAEQSGRPILVQLDAITAFMLLGQLQLALRHPGNVGPAAETARDFAEQLEAFFAPWPALAQVAAMGWDPAYDAPRAGGRHADGG